MGCLLSVCGLGQLACCAGSAACGIFSCCMPSSHPRVMYTLMLFAITILGWIMSIPNVSSWLKSWVPFCWGVKSNPITNKFEDAATNFAQSIGASSFLGSASTNQTTNYCDDFTGYTAIYRLMFATTMFFLLFGLLTFFMNLCNSGEKMSKLHKGFWCFKLILLGGGIVGAFFIPNSDAFFSVWKVFGLSGAFLFLLIQFLLIIIFADELANGFGEDSDERCQLFKYLGTTLLSIVLTIVGYVLYYIYYGGSGCSLHNFAISINLIICVGLCIASILPIVQEKQPGSGLVQSSIVSLYICYLTWSALSSSPYHDCKSLPIFNDSKMMSLNFHSFLSLFIASACIFYSSLRISSNSQFDAITDSRPVRFNPHLDAESVTSDTPLKQSENNEEENEDQRSVLYFYFIFALSTLYLMMTLTNWYSPTESYHVFGQSKSAFWIKLSSSWCCAFLYVWTLFAPVLLDEYRDFS